MLGHGAGGDHTSPDLVAVACALADEGLLVARFDQPYRVAGRRAPDPAPMLDICANVVVATLRSVHGALPLVLGGRSSGARVACRISADAGAVAVVCLGFPLHPPGRPEKSRAAELAAVRCPTLVVQGERDAFGGPADVRAAVKSRRMKVHAITGADHALRKRQDEVAAAVQSWVVAQLPAT